jgi:CRP/FNR family transcriptional regulator, cyclic AMP receptor protein
MSLSALCSTDIAALLDESNWGLSMNWDELVILSQYLIALRYPDGNIIFHEGQVERSLGILVKGKLSVSKQGHSVKKETEETKLAEIKPPQVIGELSLIDGEQRSATVTSVGDTMILYLKYDRLLALQDKEPEIAYQLLWRISKLLSQRLRQTTGHLTRAIDLLK